MGLFKKDQLGAVAVPGETTVTLTPGKVIVDYDEERKGRSTEPTAANQWKGIPDGLAVALVPTDGGAPIVVARDPLGRSWAGTRRAGSRYGTAEVPAAGSYTLRVDPFTAERELHDPRIVLKR